VIFCRFDISRRKRGTGPRALRSTLRIAFGVALVAALALPSAPARAQNESTGLAAICPDPALSPLSFSTPEREDARIIMYARQLDASKTETSEARGNVEINRADQRLTTEYLQFLPETGTVVMPEALRYADSQVWIEAQRAEYSFEDESGQFWKLDYGLSQSSAHGSADSMELLPDQRSVLNGLDFTTCPGEQPDWQIKAQRMEFHHEKGYGTARHARLEFKGVPILYAPWFSFPIDDRRKSGLLYPSVSNTNDNGIEFGIPYYWNIAPNMDAIIQPRYFSNRGFMLSGDFRFLSRHTGGFVEYDYMPDDDQTGEERYHYFFEHRATLPGAWSTQLNVDRVSDDDYFQDFGASLETTSRQFLRSAGIVRGFGHHWSFEAMADDFQVIDDSVSPENEPYRRVPRLAFRLDQPFGPSGLGFILDSELAYFDRDVGVTGARADNTGHLYWERWAAWGFIRPSLGYRYTTYDLEDVMAGEDTSPDRGTTIASLDGGLFFDRTLDSGNTQTLEPRMFYLYVPFEEQDELPDFDTADFTFGFSQLFNTNRFAGADRQGDADQLSLSLTTRSYAAGDGNQLWRFSVGQIIYFEDQQVQLDADSPMLDDRSPLIAEFSLTTFRRFASTAGLQWDWTEDRLDVASFGVSYGGADGERAAFEYRFRRERVDQFDFRLSWPVTPEWRLLTRVNYSFEDDDLLETQAGFEYESCCWALRTVYRRYLKNREGEQRDGVYLELNLKGLASVGTGGEELFYY
jgi:LPS-assembly protein